MIVKRVSPAALLAIFLFGAGPSSAQLWKGKPGDIQALEKRASTGDSEAMAEFAWHLLEGVGGRRFQPDEIRSWFQKASEAGEPLGMVGLSRCLVEGIGGPADFSKAWDLANSAADAGHPEGWKQKAFLLDSGLGTVRNSKEGLELTRRAEQAGSVSAACNLLVMESSQRGSVSYTEHGKRAVQTGHLLSARNALYGYHLMRDHPDSMELAGGLIRLVESRAELEHPIALLALAYVRRCQGDVQAEAALKARALAVGTRDGYQEILGELSRLVPDYPGWQAAMHYVRPIDRRRLELAASERGVRGVWLAARVANWAITPLEGEEPDPARAAEVLRRELPDPKKQVHHSLARQFYDQMRRFNRSAISPELAVAHAIYASDKVPQSIGFTAFLLSGRQRGVEPDLAKAYAAARRPEAKRGWNDNQIAELKARLNEDDLKRSDELLANGFPTEESYIEEARQILEKAGDWRPAGN